MEAWKLVCCALAVPIVLGFLPALPLMLPIIIPVIIIGVIMYFIRPDILFKLFTDVMMWRHGLKQDFRIVNGYTFCYAKRGRANRNKPTMLYLHGFSAAKDMFWSFVPRIPKEWHVILLDLPGHGKTTRRMKDCFTYESQAQRVHQFVDAMGLHKRPLHVIGISMGGAVAGLYAANFPSDLTKLTLICPAGIKSEILSDHEIAVKEHKLPSEIPEDEEGFAKTLPYLTYTMPRVPKQYYKGLTLLRKSDNPFFKKVINDMASNDSVNSLRDNMGHITVPTQVIWGKHDRLLHASSADILREGIQDVQVHVLERCGHCVTMERPYKLAKLILKFAKET